MRIICILIFAIIICFIKHRVMFSALLIAVEDITFPMCNALAPDDVLCRSRMSEDPVFNRYVDMAGMAGIEDLAGE